MAKGKQAMETSRRRLEAAHEHIDRLTTELADAKVRMRDAEKRAADADLLREQLRMRNNDELLEAALASIEEWKRVAREDHGRRVAALRDVGKIIDDLDLRQVIPGEADRVEFLSRRYPALIAALFAGQHPADVNRDGRFIDRHAPRPVRRLSDESLRRFQRLNGERTSDTPEGRDMADIVSDLFDAGQVGFTKEEMLEYALGAGSAA